MKAKMYVIGAFLLAGLVWAISIFSRRSDNDSRTEKTFIDSLEAKEIDLHKKAAKESQKTADKHFKKAKAIARRNEPDDPKSIEEGIERWNDDSV